MRHFALTVHTCVAVSNRDAEMLGTGWVVCSASQSEGELNANIFSTHLKHAMLQVVHTA
jgi:hypothetical protein